MPTPRQAFSLTTFTLLAALMPAHGQTTASAPMPHDYRGVGVRIPGIFVTPVPNAPFRAEVEIVSHDKLPDGTEHIVTTRTHIARGSSGTIRNERRRLVPVSFQGEPRLLEVHLYNPSSRKSTLFVPETRLARETVLPLPPRPTPDQRPPSQQPALSPDTTESSLGTESLEGVELQGTRKTHTIPAELSGTGKPIQVIDEYWYSPALSIYMIIRHNDPRTGEQIVAVTHVQRGEPDAAELTVPSDFKIVDETPPTVEAVPR